ncbi:hypothetical protein CL634_05995 [bacterium]|nr:hypothetical protein [bacterium]|tara:strand:+ start:5846 stop:6199 length:354 start_codon:yes stop_codon:yes gene_type:complete
MDILSQKVKELESLMGKGNFLSRPGGLEKNESHMLLNKKTKKILVLFLSKDGDKLSAYSVDIETRLQTEEFGLEASKIMKNVLVLRMFRVRYPQSSKLQGNTYAQIPLDIVADHILD